MPINVINRNPSYVRKAIGNMRTDGEAFNIIKEACKQLKLRYECPAVLNEVAVHFLIPKLKLAIIFNSTGPYAKRKAMTLKNSGWTISLIFQHEVINNGLEIIKNNLKEILDNRR